MAEEQIIYSIVYDTQAAQKNLESLTTEQVKLREGQRELIKQYNAGSLSVEQYGKELASNQQALRQNSKQLQDTKKILDATNGSLGAQRLRLSQLKQQWIDQEKVTKEGKKRFAELGKEIQALNDDIKAQEQGVGDFRRNVGNYTQSIVDAARQTNVFGINVGQAADAFKLTTGAISGTNKLLKAFKIALASTGIGLILVALGSLVAFFSKSQRGVDLFNQGMAFVSSTFNVLTDRAARLGEIIYNVFTGKTGIIEAFAQAKDALSGFTDEVIREGNASVALEKQSQALRRSRLAYIQTEATLAAAVEKSKLALEDVTKTEQERLKFGLSALTLINSLHDVRRQSLQEELDILQKQIALQPANDKNIEDLEREAQLRAEINQIEGDRFGMIVEVNNSVNQLNKDIAAGTQKQLEDELKAFQLRNEEVEKLGAKRIEVEEKTNEEILESLDKVGGKQLEVINEQLAAEQRAKQKSLEIESLKQDAKAELANSALDLATTVLKQETVLGQVAASAQAGFNTYLAATKALATYPPPAGQIFAAAAILQGLAWVAQINNIKFAEGGIAPDKNGQILQGPSHASGGIRLEAEGGEVVLTRRVSESPYLLSLASQINEAAGGRPLAPRSYMQDGGIAVRSINQQADQQLSTRAIVEDVMRNMPPIWVGVQDMRKKIAKVEAVENRGKIG